MFKAVLDIMSGIGRQLRIPQWESGYQVSIRDTTMQAMKAAGKLNLIVETIQVVSEANNHYVGRAGWFEQELESKTRCGEGLLSQRANKFFLGR